MTRFLTDIRHLDHRRRPAGRCPGPEGWQVHQPCRSVLLNGKPVRPRPGRRRYRRHISAARSSSVSAALGGPALPVYHSTTSRWPDGRAYTRTARLRTREP
jgi:hypothetical protein